MAWVYLSIAIGAAGFLVWIILDYLNTASALRPKAELAQREIRETEMQIEAEQAATTASQGEIENLQREIAETEKELGELSKKVEGYRQRERRKNPTKFKLEE